MDVRMGYVPGFLGYGSSFNQKSCDTSSPKSIMPAGGINGFIFNNIILDIKILQHLL